MRHNFRELNIWKESMTLVEGVYELVTQLPDDEKFGFKSQIRRCSVSIPSNIAEGSGRSTDKDFRRFLDISLSSSYELETQLILATNLFKIDSQEIQIELQNLQKMIGGFKKVITS